MAEYYRCTFPHEPTKTESSFSISFAAQNKTKIETANINYEKLSYDVSQSPSVAITVQLPSLVYRSTVK